MADKSDSRAHSLHSTGITVSELPKFDLDSYIANYDGLTRLERLITIGMTSKPLMGDALRAALAEAKQGKNVPIYLEISRQLQKHTPNDAKALPDQEWVERTRKAVDKETERLESELKGYKNNLIKESIRMGNEELGAHYHATGDLGAAQKAYTKMREYCTTAKHIAEMNLKLALLHLSQRNYISLQQAVYRIQNAQLPKPDAARLEPALPPLLGLAALASGDYRAAAAHFLATDAAFIAALEPATASGIQLNRAVLSPNDVATYGTLAALATYDRSALRTHVLESPSFRQFLELEPHLRRAVAAFVAAKYAACLAALAAYRPDYLLDVHLQRHVPALLAQLRRKSIVAFFAPFDRVEIASLCDAFGGNVDAMTAELADLIGAGLLDARIDAQNNVLVAKTAGGAAAATDRRAVAEQALAAAAEHERAMKLKLWRIRMAQEGLEIPPRKGFPGPGGDGGGAGAGGGPPGGAFPAANARAMRSAMGR